LNVPSTVNTVTVCVLSVEECTTDPKTVKRSKTFHLEHLQKISGVF
jgi:hypothetical protein